jgi:hypothetical protein
MVGGVSVLRKEDTLDEYDKFLLLSVLLVSKRIV